MPGLSQETARASLRGLKCEKTAAVITGATQCGNLASNLPEEFRTLGGATLKFLMMFFGEDGNMGIMLTTLPSSSYAGLKSALTERFGAPASSEEQEVQNKLGTKFTNEVTIWQKGDDKLTLQKFGSNINEGSLRLSSIEYELQRAELSAKSKAKDL